MKHMIVQVNPFEMAELKPSVVEHTPPETISMICESFNEKEKSTDSVDSRKCIS